MNEFRRGCCCRSRDSRATAMDGDEKKKVNTGHVRDQRLTHRFYREIDRASNHLHTFKADSEIKETLASAFSDSSRQETKTSLKSSCFAFLLTHTLQKLERALARIRSSSSFFSPFRFSLNSVRFLSITAAAAAAAAACGPRGVLMGSRATWTTGAWKWGGNEL